MAFKWTVYPGEVKSESSKLLEEWHKETYPDKELPEEFKGKVLSFARFIATKKLTSGV